jgi:hypothetical protein
VRLDLPHPLAHVQTFVDHCYHLGNAALPVEHATSLLELARQFEVPLLTTRCSAKLEEHMNVPSAVDCLLFANEYVLPGLLQKAREQLVHNFADVVKEQAYSRLPFDELLLALRDPKLEVAHEEAAFEAVVRWAELQEGDAVDLTDALCALRYESMTPAFLRGTVATHSVLALSPRCHEIADAVLAIADELEGGEGGGKRPRSAAQADAGSSSNASLTTPVSSRLGGEFVTPSGDRPSVHLVRVANGGSVFTYNSSDSIAETRGLFYWLGTSGGTTEWKNPCTLGHIEAKVQVEVQGEDNKWFDDPSRGFRPFGFREELDDDGNCEWHLQFEVKEVCIDLKREFVPSGWAFTFVQAYHRPKWTFKASVDGETWVTLSKAGPSDYNRGIPRVSGITQELEQLGEGRKPPVYYACDNPSRAAYRHFRLLNHYGICRMELFGALPKVEHTAAVGEKRRRCVD